MSQNYAPTPTQQTVYKPSEMPTGVNPMQTLPGVQGQPLTPQPLTMPMNGSVVDLLNMAGQDSSFAARKVLAQQYGIQGYAGTAAQNQELSKKFLDAYNANKASPVPQSGAEARAALQQSFTQSEVQDPMKSFFDTVGSFNPIERSIFDNLSQLLSANTQKQSFVELYQQEIQKAGIPGLQMELANIKKIIDGTEDDIRDEITKAGGFATESQVQAMAGARNKGLLKQAGYISDMLDAQNEYVDRIVDLTQADRAQVEADLDRKLGISKTLVDMTSKMEDRARENYRNIIKDIGYDGLVSNISSPEELERVAKTMGLTPKSLLALSKVPTTEQRQMELAEMQYQLSVDKFNEDKRQFGLNYALEQNKLAQAKAAADIAARSMYSTEQARVSIDAAKNIKSQITDAKGNLDKTKAAQFFGKINYAQSFIPNTPEYDFRKQVESLQDSIAKGELAEMREASKTGGALGNASDKDIDLLRNSLGNLSTGQTADSFYKNLNTVLEIKQRWQATKLGISMGIDVDVARAAGWTDEEIIQQLGR